MLWQLLNVQFTHKDWNCKCHPEGVEKTTHLSWRIVPLLGTSDPVPLGSSAGQQEGEAVQSPIIYLPGSLGMETDLCQVEGEGVRQWEQSRREDGISLLKSFQREEGSVESRPTVSRDFAKISPLL